MRFFKFIVVLLLLEHSLVAQSVDGYLKADLEKVYNIWRDSMVSKDIEKWKYSTAYHKKIQIYNRIVSAHLPYPKSIFDIPVKPPTLGGLKAVNVNKKGNTAIATYFGKIDFGVGGKPSDNLMVLYFIQEGGKWKYDTADFINILALPEVKKQMLAGNYSYTAHADFMASGKEPEAPKLIKNRGYVAKVYTFCPGREVKVDINGGVSKHRFQNDKAAEIIIGGVSQGGTMISFTTKALPGSKGNEPLDLRVFLMSKAVGGKAVKVFQYRITPEEAKAGKKPATSSKATIMVTADDVAKILTK